jgi:hypothetical protein
MSSLNALRARLGPNCYYCRQEMVFRKVAHGKKPGPRQATREHLIPKVEGGDNRPDNIVLACYHCNMRQNQLWWLAQATTEKGKSKYVRIKQLVDNDRKEPVRFREDDRSSTYRPFTDLAFIGCLITYPQAGLRDAGH